MEANRPVRRRASAASKARKVAMQNRTFLCILAAVLIFCTGAGTAFLLQDKTGSAEVQATASSSQSAKTDALLPSPTGAGQASVSPSLTPGQSAASPAPSPVQNSWTAEYDKNELHVDEQKYTLDFQYIQLKNIPNKSTEDQINKLFQDNVDYWQNEMPEFSSDWDNSSMKLYCETSSSLVSQNGDYLSFIMTYYCYTGGAHPNSWSKTYFINAVTGQQYNIGDLFSVDFDAIAYLTRRLKLELPKVMYLSEEEMESFTALNPGQTYIISDNKLIIIINNYDYFSYLTGSGCVEIPLSTFGESFLLWDVNAGASHPVKYTNVKLESFLNIRQNPDASAKVAGYLLRWDAVEVLGQTGEWSRIKTVDGITGYVKTAYLSEGPALE